MAVIENIQVKVQYDSAGEAASFQINGRVDGNPASAFGRVPAATVGDLRESEVTALAKREIAAFLEAVVRSLRG